MPQGWWRYIVATADTTHFLGVFDAPTPEVILGSDLLTLIPPNIIANTYCVDERQWKKAIAPIQASTFISPPTDCNRANVHTSYRNPNYIDPYTHEK